ncbi:MAG: hypothetical protein KDK99_19750 [Verrucomicrobiales bacterium]|nr:hypothetical protein [Verrucomicrobiales bacterium]
MPHRVLTTVIALAALVTPTLAQDGCPLERATYAEGDNGYELRFHQPKEWEMYGMTESVFELVGGPQDQTLWGYISGNMGTSRDTGNLFSGCARPGPDDDVLVEDLIDECRVWTGVVYAMTSGEPAFMPFHDEPAPPGILMTDLGRTLRYSLLSGPGDEPWDYFTFKSCAE